MTGLIRVLLNKKRYPVLQSIEMIEAECGRRGEMVLTAMIRLRRKGGEISSAFFYMVYSFSNLHKMAKPHVSTYKNRGTFPVEELHSFPHGHC